MDDVVLFAGGIIPRDDIEQLEKLGFKGVFGPGSSTLDIIEWVKKNAGEPAAA
jgi:methylmalonyl-CoA mutase C-terminal domain/subunit